MGFRLYIVPVIGTGVRQDPRRPKYFEDGTIVSQPGWTYIDYGFEPIMFVGANLSVSDDNIITSKPDVQALPFDLSPNLTAGQVIVTKNFLESINIPAGWVNVGLTWIAVVRTILGLFSFVQKYGVVYAEANGVIAPSLFSAGITLNSTFGSLPQAVQNALVTTAQFFNISTAGLVAGTTMRVILKAMADAFQGSQYRFGDVLI